MMVLFSSVHGKGKTFLVVLAAAVLVGVPIWLIAPRGQAEPVVITGPAASGQTAMNLGFSYLPVTSRASEYYGLGLDAGALVTEVAPGSPADRAGLRPGDVVVGFNGTPLDGQESLLEMLIACGESQTIVLEVCAVSGTRTVRLLETEPQ